MPVSIIHYRAQINNNRKSTKFNLLLAFFPFCHARPCDLSGCQYEDVVAVLSFVVKQTQSSNYSFNVQSQLKWLVKVCLIATEEEKRRRDERKSEEDRRGDKNKLTLFLLL